MTAPHLYLISQRLKSCPATHLSGHASGIINVLSFLVSCLLDLANIVLIDPRNIQVAQSCEKCPFLFFFQLLESTVYGERKGAAYGLSGLVKGLGILYLKQLNIMSTLQEAIQDKKNYRHREGALFAYEMLCSMLGRLFEPYVVHVLPNLLLCFGDGNQYVREVREEALNWCCFLKTSLSVFRGFPNTQKLKKA